MDYQIGCDQLQYWMRPANSCSAATIGFMKVPQSRSLYLYLAYKSGFKRVRAILKAVEAVKVKLWCFKGIVHPTHFQKQVGWGT